MTYRQYRTYLYWLNEQSDEPSYTDYLLMQLTQYVHGLGGNKVKKVEGYRLRFENKAKVKPKPLTREEATAVSKGKWLSVIGMTPVIVNKPLKTDDQSS